MIRTIAKRFIKINSNKFNFSGISIFIQDSSTKMVWRLLVN